VAGQGDGVKVDLMAGTKLNLLKN